MAYAEIVALRNEKGSYNLDNDIETFEDIVALRNEKGSYNNGGGLAGCLRIVALRNEKGSYNYINHSNAGSNYCSTAK